MTRFRQRLSDIAGSASALTWVGFAIAAGFLALACLMVAGYGLTDPGGWKGLGLTALWLGPLVALSALAFYRPDASIPVLAVATLPAVGFGVWALLDYEGARGWEDQNGPVSLVLVLVVAPALVVLGLSRPRPAGLLLVGVTVVPLVLEMIGAGSQWLMALSIGVVYAPILIGGVLYLIAGRSQGGTVEHVGPPRATSG